MGELTFQSIMDFYPKHNRSTFQKLVEEQKKGIVIPFVGAGLSQPFGYKLWGDVLKELIEYIPEESQKETVLQLLREWKYTEAAQAIYDAYPYMMDFLPDLISPEQIQKCAKEKLEFSAAYVLPDLFSRGLVTTTNFDRVIEHVYLQATKNPISVVTPSQPDRLTQLQQNTSLALFKLHGDIGPEAISYDDLIFTEKQYNDKYADGSALIKALSTAFSTKRLLFLGCSLAMDRTMDVLKTVNKAQPQIRHFAIVGCKKEDKSKRLNELSQLGIMPIFYENGNHDAVRVLLERLLEETNQAAYQKLCRAKPKLLSESKEERRLLYDGEYFPFTGRKEEWQRLQDFCNDPETVSWWAVTGPGGMGKSRLVYEFAKGQKGWQICRFTASPSRNSAVDSLANLLSWQPGTEPTLVVLDDVQAFMQPVAQWLQKIVRCPRSEKLRILLLEREGSGLQDAEWLTVGVEADIPVDWCYAEKFLELKAMSDQELMAIMNAFAAASGKKLNAELLLKTLERIDPELKRPLYAIAIADAFCQGKDPTNWDKTQVLDVLLKREVDFHIDRLRGIIGKKPNKTLLTEFRKLLAQSCIGPGLLLEEVDISQYPHLEKEMNAVNMELEEFVESVGILHRAKGILRQVEEKNGEEIILEERKCVFRIIGLFCPDLIKEHLVLEQVSKPSNNSSLLPDNWEEDPNHLQFLRRLLDDYPERLEAVLDWNTAFQAKPKYGLCAAIWGDFLIGCIIRYPKKWEQAIDCLNNLYQEHSADERIVAAYARGLFNLTVRNNLTECSVTVGKLEELYKVHATTEEVVLLYARGLVNLSVLQDVAGCGVTIGKLEELYEAHRTMEKVEIQYAKGLGNLSYQQVVAGCNVTIGKLKELYEANKTTEEWACVYATGLVNLSMAQNLQDCTATLKEIMALQAQYTANNEITLCSAMTWFNLTLHQEEEDIPDTVQEISGFLHSNDVIIQPFHEKLEEYLTIHPEQSVRYKLLQEVKQPV